MPSSVTSSMLRTMGSPPLGVTSISSARESALSGSVMASCESSKNGCQLNGATRTLIVAVRGSTSAPRISVTTDRTVSIGRVTSVAPGVSLMGFADLAAGAVMEFSESVDVSFAPSTTAVVVSTASDDVVAVSLLLEPARTIAGTLTAMSLPRFVTARSSIVCSPASRLSGILTLPTKLPVASFGTRPSNCGVEKTHTSANPARSNPFPLTFTKLPVVRTSRP